MDKFSQKVAAFFVVVAGLSVPIHANACSQISSLPVTISESGTYCLSGDIHVQTYDAQTYGLLIRITADNVTLDLNGYQILGYGNHVSKGVQSIGSNVVIKNGGLANMSTGIIIKHDSLVENVKLHDISGNGIIVSGSNTTVRNNIINGLGGSDATSNTVGISAGSTTGGTGNVIANNVITGIYNPNQNGKASGILISHGGHTFVENNYIKANIPSYDFTDKHVGIRIEHSNNTIVSNNRFLSVGKAMVCGVNSGAVRFRDNISNKPLGTPSHYSGCGPHFDLGGND